MKVIFSISIAAILFACSPKYQEINDNGFGGGGSKTFNKTVLNTNSKLEKVDDQLAANDQQRLEALAPLPRIPVPSPVVWCSQERARAQMPAASLAGPRALLAATAEEE
jgi:hypothetical protein